MLSIHRLSAGDGYKYLIRHIATADVDRRMATPLTAYYVADGYPPGRWTGNGLPGLGNGEIKPGDEVTEEQMAALFGRAQDPVDGKQLGRPFRVYRSLDERVQARIADLPADLSEADRAAAISEVRRTEARVRARQAVAGFDLTFSPVKSVSALWATADVGVKEQIAAAQYDAVNDVLSLIEDQAVFTRTGDGGVAQVDTCGVIATAFDHWDTRSGDPQLHTHMVIANRVQSTDGQWKTLDGRVLFRSAVAMSEIHNVLLADGLARRLGVNWELRDRGAQRNPAFEITGVPDELLREFSSRTEQIESNLELLLARRPDAHSSPSRTEMYVLRQQATLMNRPPKHLAKPLADLMVDWRRRADIALGTNARAALADCLAAVPDRLLTRADLTAGTLDAYGATVVLALQAKRATWTRWNILAEAARQTRLLRLATTQDRLDTLEAIADRAEHHSISLTPGDLVNLPGERVEGESIYRIHNGAIFTSPVVLGAERLLLDLAQDHTGPTATTKLGQVSGLTADRRQALTRLLNSGQRLEALVGPAGTGKTSLLATLHEAWETTHGPSSVIGIAPSSTAADVLSGSLRIPTDNLAKWIHEAVGLGAEQRNQRIANLERAARIAEGLRRKRRQQRILTGLAALRADADRWRFHPNQLVIVDEASMAGTMELATLARETSKAGAKLLLVGDHAQLGAVDTGGAFRLVAKETQAANLQEVWRFTHDWERNASLQLRTGNLDIIATYDDHERLTSGTPDDCEINAYTAWLADTRSNRTSLLIAADNTTVNRLNARARLDRITTGEVEPHGVTLHDGTEAGLGDHIVTRLNNRHLTYGTNNNFVRNGNTWTVVRHWNDGSLTVEDTNHQTITLPAAYVANSVELAYATTVHRAQGITVDTAHLVVTERMTRPLLYVGITRGRQSNNAYVATHEPTSDLHEPHTPESMHEILATVLDQEGIEKSAHETMQGELDNATNLAKLVPIHEHLCQVAAGQRYRTTIDTSTLDPSARAELRASPAYGPLLAALRRAEASGLDPQATFHKAVTQANLDNARDLAAVLHTRVERQVVRSDRRRRQPQRLVAGLVRPTMTITDPAFTAPLRELEGLISQRADWLAEQAEQHDPPWHQAVMAQITQRTPDDSRVLVREVAAYRERYGIRGGEPLGIVPPARELEQSLIRSRLAAKLRTVSDSTEHLAGAASTHQRLRSDEPDVIGR